MRVSAGVQVKAVPVRPANGKKVSEKFDHGQRGFIQAMVAMGSTLFGSESSKRTRVTGPSAPVQVISKGLPAVTVAKVGSVKLTFA
jgi:hypothetical protein